MEPQALVVGRLRHTQWIVVALWIVMITGSSILEWNDIESGRRTPLGCAVGALNALAHGIWITLVAQILNRRVGAWRFGAFFLGPFAIWFWFLTQYGRKGLVLIPIS